MAGPFKGNVNPLRSAKSSASAKRAKGKKVVSLVKRSSKLPQDTLQLRIAQLIGGGEDDARRSEANTNSVAGSADGSDTAARRQTQLLRIGSLAGSDRAGKRPSSSATSVSRGKSKHTMEIVGKETQRVAPESDERAPKTTAELHGQRLLQQAIKNQSHLRVLPHQQRHDYEYRLRMIATTGVVRLFNSLAQARRAGESAMEAAVQRVTVDKATERKHVASREAFLAALRQPSSAATL